MPGKENSLNICWRSLEIAGDPGDCWRSPHRYSPYYPVITGITWYYPRYYPVLPLCIALLELNPKTLGCSRSLRSYRIFCAHIPTMSQSSQVIIQRASIKS
eukprot:1093264-Amorphochlora_amoeboformis.AAC.1